ncbi:Hcp family type VI secretion system effector [Phycicoccus avicenniae]|uniref:Hcp family type VI secretion system effector n=1 Tax=Phycicoccus avicenniae TaxID=2828860 RepID=UPI003D2AF46E
MTSPTTPADLLGGGLVLPGGATASEHLDIHLTLDGIPGDSTSTQFPGSLDLLAFDWSVRATPTGAGGGGHGGAGVGRPVAGEVRVAALTSSASPRLLRHLVTGRHVQQAAIHVLRGGEHPVEALTLGLTDVLVTGYEVSTSGGWPVDLVSFTMRTVTETFVPQNADGSLGTPVSVTWDLRTTRVD